MALITANGDYKYSDIHYNKTLDEHVQECHKYNCKKNDWKYIPLKKGGFGYDNLAVSISFTLNKMKDIKEITIDNVAKLVHEGWCINYIYWRDNQPWITNNKYSKPFVPLNDDRRNKCAELSYDKLDKEEQEKDCIIAEYIISIYKKD